jgi:nicotinamidase-related amidase
MTGSGRSQWLVVIDLQPAFADPTSPWFAPSLGKATKSIAEIVPLYGEHVVFTRFVPPARLSGSWHAYYRKWPFALDAEASWLWDVVDPWKAHRSVASHMFSKWEPLRDEIGAEAAITLCGVSTDCCVLATALAAVDGGAEVRVVTDACAAKTPEAHEGALAIMSARAPQLTLVSAAEELACRRAMAVS